MANKEIMCATCTRGFIPTRSDAQYCSPACRQKAYRQSKVSRPKVTTGLALRSELTPRQLAFVREYAIDHNGVQAAIRAGYSKRSAGDQATRLLKHDGVNAALRARTTEALARLEVTEDLVLQELAAIAFSNIEDYVEWDKDAGALVVKSSAEIPRHLAAAIESIDEQVMVTENKDGTRTYTRTKRRVKLYNKLDALKVLGEYLGVTESMAPKVTVHLVTGINRDPEPEAVTIKAEPG